MKKSEAENIFFNSCGYLPDEKDYFLSVFKFKQITYTSRLIISKIYTLFTNRERIDKSLKVMSFERFISEFTALGIITNEAGLTIVQKEDIGFESLKAISHSFLEKRGISFDGTGAWVTPPNLLTMVMLFYTKSLLLQDEDENRAITLMMMGEYARGQMDSFIALREAESMYGKINASRKVKKSPKTPAKEEIKLMWQDWQLNPPPSETTKYKSAAKFSAAMWERFTNEKTDLPIFESPRKIETWCTVWKKEKNNNIHPA